MVFELRTYPKEDNRTRRSMRINFRVSREEHREMTRKSRELGMPFSSLVREALRRYLRTK